MINSPVKKNEVIGLHDYELDMLCFNSLSLSRFPIIENWFCHYYEEVKLLININGNVWLLAKLVGRICKATLSAKIWLFSM